MQQGISQAVNGLGTPPLVRNTRSFPGSIGTIEVCGGILLTNVNRQLYKTDNDVFKEHKANIKLDETRECWPISRLLTMNCQSAIAMRDENWAENRG